MVNLNWKSKDTQYFVDEENKMMLSKNAAWNPNGDNGKGDAIGRNKDAYFIYRDPRFIEGIENCWVRERRKTLIGRIFKGKYYYQGYRYPTYATGEEYQSRGLSRDHVLNTVIAYKLAGKTDKEIWEFVRGLKWKISDYAKHRPDLWIWERAMAGRKFAKWLSPRITYITMKLTCWYQLKLEKISGIGPHYEEHQYDFERIQNHIQPKIVNTITKTLYPVYTMHQQACQIQFYNDKWKKKIQDVMYKFAPSYNYAIKLLLDHTEDITEKDINDYKAMKGWRWSGIMNKWWNDRDMSIQTDEKLIEHNIMDVDYLKKLWEIHSKK